MDKRIPIAAALIVSALAGWYALAGSNRPDSAPGAAAPAAGTVDAAQMTRLGIRLEAAQQVDDLPLGSVPGQIALSPDGRVAVTVPYGGVLVRLLVIEGQPVRQGQPLAVVRAPDAIRYGGDLARARADLALAEAQAGRMRQLHREGIVARARLDEAEARLQQARATAAESRRQLAAGGASGDGSITLRAPIAGRVAHVAVETGGPVDPLTAPIVIENPSAFQVELQLPEALARRVQPGMGIEVEVPAGTAGKPPETARGKLLTVAPSLDPATRSVMARASIEPVPGLVSGKGVMVLIRDAGTTGGITVPAGAVTYLDGQPQVFVREGQRFVRRKVILATQVGGRAVIAGGLRPGEQVAVSGITELKTLLAE
ncbi:MAG: efflux RND transporter periplasmic adaptor subunit [Novosphingobium sp.]